MSSSQWSADSAEPEKGIVKATNSVVFRILVFFVGSIFLLATILPWNSTELGDSPYVAAMEEMGIPAAADIMNAVVLTAVLSCLNSGLYTASRMAFSLGERGDAPKAFARTTSRGVPRNAIIVSVVFGFVAVFFNYEYPESVFLFLVNSSGAVALFVWLVICFSQLRMRKIIQAESPEKLVVRMWLYPYLTWATAGLIVFILGYMLTDTEHDGRTTVLLSLLVAAIVIAIAFVKEKLKQPDEVRTDQRTDV